MYHLPTFTFLFKNKFRFYTICSCIILCLLAESCSTKITKDESPGTSTLKGETNIMKEIVKYASLAPSGHNTQPWKFYISTNTIKIKPDYSRKLPLVDPDDRELFISLGCALENLVIAAEHFGYTIRVKFNLEKEYEEEIIVSLDKGEIKKNDLLDQITLRQTTRNEYNRKSVPLPDLDSIKNFITSDFVQSKIITDSLTINEVTELVKEGNIRQFKDARFMDELKFWIRFSESESEEKKDGLSAGSSGNPSVPRWLGKIFMDLFYSANDQNEKDEKFIKSSAGLILFYSTRNDKRTWIETGRIYEKFSLLTTKMDIKCAFINQPIEIKDLNEKLSKVFQVGKGIPQLLLRFGYSDLMPKSPRRNLENIIIKERE